MGKKGKEGRDGLRVGTDEWREQNIAGRACTRESEEDTGNSMRKRVGRQRAEREKK